MLDSGNARDVRRQSLDPQTVKQRDIFAFQQVVDFLKATTERHDTVVKPCTKACDRALKIVPSIQIVGDPGLEAKECFTTIRVVEDCYFGAALAKLRRPEENPLAACRQPTVHRDAGIRSSVLRAQVQFT